MDDSKNKKILKYRKHLFCLGSFLFVLLEFFIPRDPYFWFDGLPGFYTVFGLVSCFLIIIICKALGQHWLMVREDYYDLSGNGKKGEKAP
ncbi:MAG: hypothetical protein DDT31_00823 [Syntrophomonadaceae bacterium]|nr:hypothetical protein [Bacillota bacterium]